MVQWLGLGMFTSGAQVWLFVGELEHKPLGTAKYVCKPVCVYVCVCVCVCARAQHMTEATC